MWAVFCGFCSFATIHWFLRGEGVCVCGEQRGWVAGAMISPLRNVCVCVYHGSNLLNELTQELYILFTTAGTSSPTFPQITLTFFSSLSVSSLTLLSSHQILNIILSIVTGYFIILMSYFSIRFGHTHLISVCLKSEGCTRLKT